MPRSILIIKEMKMPVRLKDNRFVLFFAPVGLFLEPLAISFFDYITQCIGG